MSAPLFPPNSCCQPQCDDSSSTQVPGPPGTNGATWRSGSGAPADSLGANGDFYLNTANGDIWKKVAGVYVLQLNIIGQNSYSVTSANFTVPAISGSVAVTVANSSWAANGQVVYVTTAGYYTVTGIPDSTHLTLTNLGYSGNAAPTTIIAFPQAVAPGGLQGPTGPTPSDTLNDLSPTTTKGDLLVDNGANSPNANVVRLGVGSDGQTFHANSGQPSGLQWGAIDLTGVNTALSGSLPLANGGTAGTDAATARTSLGAAASGLATASGLTSSATDRVIGRSTAGAGALEEITCTSYGRTLLATATAAAARTALNVSSADFLIFEHQETSGTDGGTFTNGAWQTVPITTEVADTGNNGSLAANIITLAAGTYRFSGWMNGFSVDDAQSRLFNVDTASVIAYGRCTTGSGSSTIISVIEGRFTIAIPTQIRLEARCTTTKATDGFGKALSFGTEIYAGINFWKE